MQHSKVGASSCERWWNCPGSVALIAQCPISPQSKFAAEGTLAHQLSEEYLNGEKKMGYQRCGETFMVGNFEIEVTEEMVDAVMLYSQTIIDDQVALDLPDECVSIEKKFQLKEIDSNAFGTNDCSLFQPFGKLKVYDLKYGKGVDVQAENNKQLLYYALGASQGLEFTEVELVIIQARKEDPIRRWTVTREELEQFAKELKKAIEATRNPKAPVKEGKHCKFCPALAICPAVKEKVLETAQTDFAAPVLSNPGAMAVGDFKKILDFSYLINDWVSEVQKHALAMVESGQRIPGYKLVKKRANRIWVDSKVAEVRFADILGESAFTKKFKTPAQLEKLAGKKVVAEYVTKPDAGVTLVDDSDKREEVKCSAQSDFTEIG